MGDDVGVIDQNMPGMNGLELLKRLHESDEEIRIARRSLYRILDKLDGAEYQRAETPLSSKIE